MPDAANADHRGPDPAREPSAEPSARWQPSREEIDRWTHAVLADPAAVAVEFLQLRHEREQLQARCQQAAAAAENMHAMLEELLQPKAALYSLDHFYYDDEGQPRALVNLNGQRRELPVAAHVDPEDLQDLQPWEYVKVHPTELIVVGVYRDESLHARAQGELATFKGYHDQGQGLVTVSRFSHDEEIVSLSAPLRERPLNAGDRLVLSRDNPRWAIDVVPAQQIESKFEIPAAQLTTRLEDLAGLEEVAGRIMEDWLPRLVDKEIGAMFDLDPIKGMILFSYKAGMGKTALTRALARWLHDLGQARGFDVVIYNIQPGALKSMWHGEDARLVREEVCGTIQARLNRPRSRPLIILVVFDEVESLGKRTGGNDTQGYVSPAQNDAVQALLSGMDGIQPLRASEGPPADVLWIGLTNRPDMLDEALKRPGRMGDLIVEMPDYDAEAAARILEIYARSRTLPWYLDGEVRQGVSPQEIFTRMLRPAVAQVFAVPVMRYTTEGRPAVEVTVGEMLAGVHYQSAMGRAKRRASVRALRRVGAPAVGFEDLADALLEEACSVAGQLDADRQMLQRQLHLRIPVLRTELIPEEQLARHRYLRAVAG